MNINTSIYENLNKSEHDKYEYIFPKISITQDLSNKINNNGNIYLKNEFFNRNYDTNIYERNNYNEIKYLSNPEIFKNRFQNNFEFILKNQNSNNKKTPYKNDTNIFYSGIFQFNSMLPMIKDEKNLKKTINPKIAIKLAPENTADKSNDDNKIDLNNVYSINRIYGNDTIEGGISATYGFDYSIFKKTQSKEGFRYQFANNLRVNEND